jgi:hypothetical protein
MEAFSLSTATAAEPHVFLIGRPPIQEYLAFVAEQTIEGKSAETRQLVDAWRTANDHVLELETSEAGIADEATLGELEPELLPLRERVLADPMVQRTFALTPIDVAVVELDRLVVYQKHINLTHVERIRPRVAAIETAADLFRFSMPYEGRVDPPTAAGGGPGGWTFKSPSNDLRPLGAKVLDPKEVSGLDVAGVPTHVVAIAVGYGANYFSAAHVDGRLILWNGSHRAYALREAGHTHVPCLMQHVSRRDELEAMGQPEVSANADRYLTAARPPILRDYFDDALRLVAHVQPSVRVVQIPFNPGAADLPA